MQKQDTKINANKYTLGKESFRTWGDVRNHAKQILSKGRRKLRGKNFLFILDLLSYHPYCKEKTEHGVKLIKVDNPNYGNGLCFVIVDNNGKEEDFSHYKCTPGKDKEKVIKAIQQRERLECYRDAIRPQILDFRTSDSVTKCAICNKNFHEIKKNNKIQVDHRSKSFVTLVSEFESQYRPKIYPTPKRCKDSIQTISFCTDNPEDINFVNSWQKYHKDNADFQMVCAGCNMRKQDGSRYKPYIN